MSTVAEKANFLKIELAKRLAVIDPATAPLWGKMNVQQMIEHMSGAMRQASGKIPAAEVLTPAENIPRMQAFIQSDKPFKENTPNALLPDEPMPTKHASIQDALQELQQEIDYFFAHYQNNAGTTVRNPFFGDLDYDLQVHLLYKHAQHHLRQFGAVV